MTDTRQPCGRCEGVERHTWTEGDCVLPHSYTTLRHPPKATIGHVCSHCVVKHRSWLTEIVELYATLVEVLLPGSIPDNTAEHMHPKKGDFAAAPVRLEVLAMTADRARLNRTGEFSDLPDVPSVLTDFARHHCDEQGWEGASLTGNASTAANMLTTGAEQIAGYPWIDEYDAELGWMRTHLRNAHGISNQPARPVGHCPSLNGDGVVCGGPLWPDGDGRMAVECGRCHRSFDERFLSHLGGMLAS